jgi:hypothetical protein
MKKILAGTLAVIIAVCTLAFTDHQQVKSPTSVVWQYEPVNSNGPSDPLNYVKLSATQPFDCEGSDVVCQILAEEDLNTHKPIIQSGDDPSVQRTEYQTTFRDL